jgi:hypothetical protein
LKPRERPSKKKLPIKAQPVKERKTPRRKQQRNDFIRKTANVSLNIETD